MPKCPCCQADLTEAQVKSLWASYCSSRVSPEQRRKSGKAPWKQHSEKAGKRCRCPDCLRIKALEAERIERMRPKPPRITEEELTWEAIMDADPTEGYELLIRREASLQAAQMRRKTRGKINAGRYETKLKKLKLRAEAEGVYNKIKAEAKRRAKEKLEG